MGASCGKGSAVMRLPSTILLDTNTWIDSCIGTRTGSAKSRQLLCACVEKEISVCLAITSLKDIYYQVGAELKRERRATGEALTEAAALAIEEVSWQSVMTIVEQATIVPADTSDVTVARYFHQIHRDFEDDLVLAGVERSGADYLITNDKRLRTHAPVAAITPADMLTLLESFE